MTRAGAYLDQQARAVAHGGLQRRNVGRVVVEVVGGDVRDAGDVVGVEPVQERSQARQGEGDAAQGESPAAGGAVVRVVAVDELPDVVLGVLPEPGGPR